MDQHALQFAKFHGDVEEHSARHSTVRSTIALALCHDRPHVPMLALDTLWFQVARNTIGNRSARTAHCFVTGRIERTRCSRSRTVESRLAEAREIGVKEYDSRGGDPFLNREMIPILAATLQQGPATVLRTEADCAKRCAGNCATERRKLRILARHPR